MPVWPAGVISILLLGVLLLISASVFAPSYSLPEHQAARYLPAPGSSQRLQVGPQQRVATSEYGLKRGLGIALTAPIEVVNKIRPVGPAPQTQWLPEVLTVDSSPADPQRTAQVTLRSTTPAGVFLHARYGPDELALEPALLELPPDLAPDRSWSSTGRIIAPQGTGEYRNESSARSLPDGCLSVTSRTTVLLGGQQVRLDTATWCPGRGVVSGTPTLGEARQQFRGDFPRPAAVPPVPSPQPAGILTHPPAVIRLNGDTPTPWARPVEGNRPVGLTASGSLFTIGQLTGDLAAHRPDGDSLRADWWGSPTGAVQGLSVLGDTVLVTTSERRLVAYADSGLRLWARPLGDLSPEGAVPIGSDAVVLSTLAGRLEAYDLHTGEPRWSLQVPDGASGRPQVIGETVYVGRKDNAGFAAVDAGTGRLRWTNDDLDAAPLGFAEDRGTLLVPATNGLLLRVEAASGDSLNAERGPTGATRLLPGADPSSCAVQTPEGVLLFATETGQQLAELPGARDVDATEQGWWIRDDRFLRLLDPQGQELRQLPLTGEVAPDARIVPGSDRIWLVGSRGDHLDVVWVR